MNPNGLILQGYLADAAGNITGTTGDLQIATRQSPANASAQVGMAVNLNASATAPIAAFTLDGNGDGIPGDPANYNFSKHHNGIRFSQGGAHQIKQCIL